MWEEHRAWALARSNSPNLAKLVDLLFRRPVITVRMAQETLGVTRRAAGLLVDRMVQDELLVEVTGNARNRRFVAVRIVLIVAPDEEAAAR